MSETANIGNARPKGLLKAVAKNKPHRPTLDRPVNLSAYMKATYYRSYIKDVLDPATHIGRSTVTTVVLADNEVPDMVEDNNRRFDDLITHELSRRYEEMDMPWVREAVFPTDDIYSGNFKTVTSSSKDLMVKGDLVAKVPAFNEEEVVTWLDSLTKMLHAVHAPNIAAPHREEFTPSRIWSNRTSNSAPAGGSISRKPDIALYHASLKPQLKKAEFKPSWEMIKAFIEVSKTPKKLTDMLCNIVEKQGGILQWAERVAPANGHTVATHSSPPNSVDRWSALSITGNSAVVD